MKNFFNIGFGDILMKHQALRAMQATALAFFICSAPVAAQQTTPAEPTAGVIVAPARPAVAAESDSTPGSVPAIRSEKPAIVVMNFESGTVSAQAKDKHGFSAFIAAMRGQNNNERYDPADLGAGIADMLVEKLLAMGDFRLFERKQIQATAREQALAGGAPAVSSTTSDTAIAAHATMIGARYVVTGSVTKFGFEEHQVGGFLSTVATFGLLSVKKHKTLVKLTARVIDTRTGEIVASFSGEGVSNKGGGISLLGLGANGGGGGNAENKNFKETAIGEATERAVRDIAEKLQSKKAALIAQ